MVGVPRRGEKERDEKTFEDIGAENFQHGKGNSQLSPEMQRVPHRINPVRNMPKHILIKQIKQQQYNKQHTRETMTLTAFFTAETWQVRK